ncbi:cupin domain-containing protein [Prolixibacter denitrificans]|uniref:Mannose-6-phosphate isomerase n=2 Tax=Prolixibacter denitrificans TaxID=1541063 RepID=A0ABQ0ZME7_9BACT|nr:cupin domain-containing protein [Prolixibacter denitrificans]GET22652.1 mannose-6-phosphate isomerase [Prolixibacter denitrificans]
MKTKNSVMSQIEKINLKEKFSKFSDHWSPKVIGQLNHQQVKVVKFQGDFVWHSHENEDELFMVIDGSFTMELRDKTIEVHEGELIIIPRGVEHRPIAKEEVSILLFEPGTIVNTGEVRNQLTVEKPDHI